MVGLNLADLPGNGCSLIQKFQDLQIELIDLGAQALQIRGALSFEACSAPLSDLRVILESV